MTSQEKTEEFPLADIFDEDEIEKNFLLSKPVCFVVLGKPVSLSVLEEHIAAETAPGAVLQSMLVKGHSIPDEVVMKLILEKLNSSEVSHFGYIITEIPSITQDTMSALQQVELIKNLKLKPDIIINIKCPDYDLCQRISGQRQHNSTGYIYARDQWDPEIIESRRKKKKDAPKEGKAEEEEEEEEQEEEEAFMAEMQMVAEIFQHLVQRPEDCLENIQDIIKLYKDTILHALEEVMAEHDPQYLIELDGNQSPEELFTTVIERLKYLNLKRAAVLTKLQSAEEEMSDVMENEELFRTLSSYKLIAPRYRWQRSKWGRMCPVALKEGNIYPGLGDFAVSFLGKMYCLSSEEALKAFLLNPRPYLLPPMPLPPCKLFIFGPHCSGRTTLSNLIAQHYKGKVVDYAKVIQPRFDEAREVLIKNTIAEATKAAIKAVKEKLLTELQAKKQAETALREFQKQYGQKEVEEPPEDKELQSSIDEEGKKRNTVLVLLTRSQLIGELVVYAFLLLQNVVKNPQKAHYPLQVLMHSLTHSTLVPLEDAIEEVSVNHPEVVSILEETLKRSKDVNFEQPYEKYAEILDEVLKEVMEDNTNRFPGAPKYGGWIVDNCPIQRELWLALLDKGIIPDLVIYLSDAENDGKCLLHRLYLENKSKIDADILARLLGELQNKKEEEEEEARKAKEEELRMEEEEQRTLDAINEKAKGKHRLT
uniref:Uncharacterized protein n=1 Tax=Castor canadensis TaxID=51338 RepID=A0A8C0X374_CASCN